MHLSEPERERREERKGEEDRQEKRGKGRRNIAWVESTVLHVKSSNFLFLNQSGYVLSFRNYFYNEVISRTYLFLEFLYKPLHFCNRSSDVLFSMLTLVFGLLTVISVGMINGSFFSIDFSNFSSHCFPPVVFIIYLCFVVLVIII